MDELSILTTIKKMLGIEEDYEHFDVDITVLINSSFMKLMQLGVGPQEGFSINDKTTLWKDYLNGRIDLEAVKSFIYMDVRLTFDPPTPHYVATAMAEQVKELGWRLNVQVEGVNNNGNEQICR